jgi:hypothetical protein
VPFPALIRLGGILAQGFGGGGGSAGPSRIDPGAGIEIEGLTQFRKDLKRLEPAVAKEMTQDIRTGAAPMLASARSLAPRLSGELSRSIRLSVAVRGAEIVFPRTEYITKPVEAGADALVENIGDSVERTANRLGWH